VGACSDWEPSILTTISDNIISRFAQAELMTFDLSMLPIDEQRATAALKDDVATSYANLNSGSAKRKRHTRFQIPHTTPEDYSERLVELDSQRHVICGIRHMNLNPERPFIALRANFRLFGTEIIEDIYWQIQTLFTVFEPGFIAVQTRKPIGSSLGNVHMAQRARVIQELSPWPTESKIQLKRVRSRRYFDWYRAGYASFHERNPHMVEHVPANPLETMEESREVKLLYYMMIDAQQAGLIAAVQSDFLGHPGLYFNEIFITEEFAGQGYAKALQRKFIAQCTSPDEIVWGTIDALNLPSYKTARANNRMPIRHESFIPIPQQ
jgi:hypothetical protein